MDENRESGAALVLVLVVGIGLMVLSTVSLNSTMARSIQQRTQHEAFTASTIAESAVAQALAQMKEAGIQAPVSGGGSQPTWVSFSSGDFYYYTDVDLLNGISYVRAWGRLQVDSNIALSTEAPDSGRFDMSGVMMKGIEITVQSTRYIPESPVYFGNGGIERPLGGFSWTGASDPADPNTWGKVTGRPSSYQSRTVPFESSALDWPPDYLYAGGAPAPATATPHPFNLWSSQNPIGQANTEAWFANSAGRTSDPTVNLTPPPTPPYWDVSDKSSPDYPYPVDPGVPDVQSFAWELWNTFKNNDSVTKLGQGSHTGTYGDLNNPGVTFVSGGLTVPAGQTFKGSGVLVIRDDYDPNVDTNNRPSRRARLDIDGTFEWTGLVIVAGWAPDIDVASGGEASIVGALFGEDSVQSGGEISLDSATIIMRIRDTFRVNFSSALFQSGGPIHELLPLVNKEVVGIRDLSRDAS